MKKSPIILLLIIGWLTSCEKDSFGYGLCKPDNK